MLIDELLPNAPRNRCDAIALFDSAATVDPDFIIGTWRGAELATGHPLDGLLAASGWWGKQQNFTGTIAALRPALQTRKPKARLRTMRYRGSDTATMVYDQLPIHDVFRKVSNSDGAGDTVIGAMDLRGSEQPYFFVLQRDNSLRLG